MQNAQSITLVSTLIILVLSFLLAVSLTNKFRKTKFNAHLYWGLGIWAFTLGALLEVIFAFGVYNNLLSGLYLFVVALVVELLALGSVQLVKSEKIKITYYAFVALTTLALLYSIVISNNNSIVVNHVASGLPPLLVIYTSSAITFVASAVLVVLAASSYKRKRDPRLLSIIIGVVVVVFAGTLYIISFPSLLYYSEFIGILLLWFGFSSSKK